MKENQDLIFEILEETFCFFHLSTLQGAVHNRIVSFF